MWKAWRYGSRKELPVATLADVRSRPHLGLEPSRCALLVVDMLRHFVDPTGRAFVPEAPAIVPRLAELLGAWRLFRAPVVFAQHGHEGPHDLGMFGRFYADHLRAGEPDADIIAELAPRSGEEVVRKASYDAFHRTPLEQLLRGSEVSQVLVTGVLTHLCVESTARSAFDRGFEVYVAADATATRSEALQLGSLRALADGFAVVMSTAEVLARCRR